MTNAELLGGVSVLISAGTVVNGFLFRLMFNRINEMRDDLNKALRTFPKEYKLKKDCLQHEQKIEKVNHEQNERLNKLDVAIAHLQRSSQ